MRVEPGPGKWWLFIRASEFSQVSDFVDREVPPIRFRHANRAGMGGRVCKGLSERPQSLGESRVFGRLEPLIREQYRETPPGRTGG